MKSNSKLKIKGLVLGGYIIMKRFFKVIVMALSIMQIVTLKAFAYESTGNLKDLENNINKHLENRDSNFTFIYTGTRKEFIDNIRNSIKNSYSNDDYLESFERFIKEQVNQSIALSVVANKPKDLTREDLKQIKLLLDANGYSEAKLQTAWRNKTNQDIAASIVGHIRRAAIGEALIPFEQRVNNAMSKIYDSHVWTPVQRKALERLGKQLKHEGLIDRQFVSQRFASDGGDKKFDKLLDNRLDTVLEQINEFLWTA